MSRYLLLTLGLLLATGCSSSGTTTATAPGQTTVPGTPPDRPEEHESGQRPGQQKEMPAAKAVRQFTHDNTVLAVAFSPDGKYLLTGTGNAGVLPGGGAASVWDLESGELEYVLPQTGPVLGVGFSPDGKKFLTAGYDFKKNRGLVQLWNMDNGKLVCDPLEDSGRPIHLAVFLPDSKTVLTESGALWDATTGKALDTPFTANGFAHIASDGQTLLTATPHGSVQHWALPGRKAEGQPVEVGLVNRIAFSPDGTRLIVATPFQKHAWLCDASTGKRLRQTPDQEEQVMLVAFSPDGKLLVTGAGRTARFWDAATCQPVGLPMVHEEEVRSMAFSPNARLLATGSVDKTAQLWEVPAAVK